MLASAGAIYGVGASSAFDLARLDLAGIRWTDRAAVEAVLDLPVGTNLFRLSTEPLEARLHELATVERATVAVRLPGTLAVTIDEREPILAWQTDARRLLVDRTGTLFAELTGGASEAPAIPVVSDERESSARYRVGSRLDPVDLDAATRLASLAPADVGSAAEGLRLQVTDTHGLVIRSEPAGWAAVFGFYTPSLRTPEMIPGQVRALRSVLLAEGERNVARIILASEDGGTFTTPAPSPADP